MDVKNRILLYIKHLGIPIKQFEEKSSLSNGYISSMRKGFGTEKLENVLNAFPLLNRDWLLYGEGDMEKTDKKEETPQHAGQPEDNVTVSREAWEMIKMQNLTIQSQQRTIELLSKRMGNEETRHTAGAV